MVFYDCYDLLSRSYSYRCNFVFSSLLSLKCYSIVYDCYNRFSCSYSLHCNWPWWLFFLCLWCIKLYDWYNWFSRLPYCFSWSFTQNHTWFLTLFSYLPVMTVTTGHAGCALLNQSGIYNAKYSYYFQFVVTGCAGCAFYYLLAA